MIIKYLIEKRYVMMAHMDTGLKIHDRLAIEANRCRHNWIDDKRKDNPNPKRSLKRIQPEQLETDNVLTDDVENTNSTN